MPGRSGVLWLCNSKSPSPGPVSPHVHSIPNFRPNRIPLLAEPRLKQSTASSCSQFYHRHRSKIPHKSHTEEMAALQPRLLSRGVRQLCKQHARPACLTARRYASTKHPKGFVPPSQSDLLELRESVQEFARMDSTGINLNPELM